MPLFWLHLLLKPNSKHFQLERRSVEIRIADWQKVQDQVASRIVQLENGLPELTLGINSAFMSANVDDGGFRQVTPQLVGIVYQKPLGRTHDGISQ